MRGTRKLAAAVILALSIPTAWAQQTAASETVPPAQPLPLFDYAFGLGVGHTDNVNRSATDAVDQSILKPTFNFAINQQGSTFQAQVVGLLQYTDYLEGYFGNEFRGQLTGQLNWTISPQRLNFAMQDYSSVEPVNTRVANAPPNQQQVNVFVTGPTLTFRLGADSGWQGQADLRYINTTASKTKEFNSQRGFGALRLIRELSPTDQLSFNAEGVDVNFDNGDPLVAATKYDEYSAYARYESLLAHFSLDLALGGSRIDFAQGWPSHSGLLARASLAWRVDSRNTLEIRGVDQLADATADLTQSPVLAGAELTNPTIVVGRTVISPAVFRDRSVSIRYAYDGARFDFALSPYYTRLRQLNGSDLSRNGYGAIVGVTYLLTPRMTVGVDLGAQTTKYTSDQSRDRTYTGGINLSRQLTPHWSWSVAYSHDQRNSNRVGSGYTENEILAFVYYRR